MVYFLIRKIIKNKTKTGVKWIRRFYKIQIKRLKYDIVMTTGRNTQLYLILMCHLNPENINQMNNVLYTIEV